MPTIYKIIELALAVAFVILLSMKTEIRYKLRDYIDAFANRHGIEKIRLISKMLDCDFCLSFWLSLAFAIVFAVASNDASWLYIPILSTPLIRFIL